MPQSAQQLLDEYVEAAHQARREGRSHDYRRHLFLRFLERAFPGKAEEIELEKRVKGIRLRGFVDILFPGLVFEFKRDLEAEREAGEAQLSGYLQSPEVEPGSFGVLTDGITFQVYTLSDQGLRGLGEPVDLYTLTQEEPDAALRWLDSFLFSQKGVRPTSDDVVLRFGESSAVFFSTSNLLQHMYDRVADQDGWPIAQLVPSPFPGRGLGRAWACRWGSGCRGSSPSRRCLG